MANLPEVSVSRRGAPVDDKPAPEHRCRVCKTPIEDGATKCIACSSYQDWRRFFGANEVVLSLLVALTTVLTAAVPVAKRALTPNRSEMHLRSLACNADHIEVFAFNAGNTPAVLESATVSVGGTEFTLANHGGDDVFAKETGRVLKLDVQLNGTSASLPETSTNKCGYLMQFNFVDYHYTQPPISLCCDSVVR